MKNIVKLIIGYLLIIPACIYWIGTAYNVDILNQMKVPLAPGVFELSSALIIPLEILFMVFPTISGILGISVYKKNDRYKMAALILTLISVAIMIITVAYSIETYTFPHVVAFYVAGGILEIYIYKRKN